jgi:hypothetical protein
MSVPAGAWRSPQPRRSGRDDGRRVHGRVGATERCRPRGHHGHEPRTRVALVPKRSRPCSGPVATAAPHALLRSVMTVYKDDNRMMGDLWLAHYRLHASHLPREIRAEILAGIDRELAYRQPRAFSCRPTGTLTRRPQVRRPRARVRRTMRTRARAPDDPAPHHLVVAASTARGRR